MLLFSSGLKRIRRHMASAASICPEVARLVKCENAFEDAVSAVFTEENLVLTVRYKGGKTAIQRGKEETIAETLRRVGKKMEVPLLGKDKRPKGDIKAAPPARLTLSLKTPEPLKEDETNINGWNAASTIDIQAIDDDSLSWSIPVVFNPPVAYEASIEPEPFAGVPQLPAYDVGGDDAKILWFSTPVPEVETGKKKQKKGAQPPQTAAEYLKNAVFLSEGPSYTPSGSDSGRLLTAVVIPVNERIEGIPVPASSSLPVSAFKTDCEFEKFPSEDAKGARVVTYNILYDGATVIYKTGESMYPYADPKVVELGFRKQLLMKEFVGMNADVLCLQEASSSLHEKFLKPHLKMLGYTGHHVSKTGDTREGVSLFWKNDKYEIVSEPRSVNLGGEQYIEDVAKIPELEPILKYYEEQTKVKETIEKTTTVAQIVVLKNKTTGKVIVVGNTHLWFHPKGGHIRVLQLHTLFWNMKKLGDTLDSTPEYVICGDLNCQPKSSPHVYMTNGELSASHPVWSAAPLFGFGRWDFDGEIVAAEETADGLPQTSGPVLSHPLALSDASPSFTYSNYTPGFTGRLDYILHSKNLVTSYVHPLPPKELLAVETGIPSSIFPSDHLPICVDLEWV
eukprot:TRINITY_DN6998_c0_g1_i2.p1 TRINITY_DN6998_c0_g1~~TRINITY_DN6998_c0_g1_i2.p1  ORF type:complete len:622 (+),score=82.78 TRINITY_DN6998_c0_g1_i2:62-1927(+)